ncbi:MAG: NADH-quinone oxidoreductase subunit NuoG [Anaerolineaceae bacterium]|nr:NADH-quinone oxidoreductase subunit NuoG [Anaerolineaceae bacterium]
MSDTVKIYIDDKEYDVPAGMNLVDAAKMAAGNDIPVFCYHPKMEPVGMCRMCLVEMGGIQKDRATGEVLLDDKGNPQIRWFPKLQTACTTKVSDGLVIRTNTQQVEQARENVVEFLLTSHPLDCPICDKGGECPLQNLTMEHGHGSTRMVFSDKLKLDKHVPLGDLIFLDEERCIQCARCIRFQDEVVGDDVLAFHERGRNLQIITNSDPGFDSYFSGNTSDICPVGALTTADFRFGARPWELTEVPSICPHDAAGSNISLSVRLDRDAGGRTIIKRVMPRQNEYVNEIWISDKTRFGHHFTRDEQSRLLCPQVRRGGNVNETEWKTALDVVAEALKAADGNVAALAGSSLSNEDLWELRQVVTGLGGERLGVWPPTHAGADLVAQVGVGQGTNLGDLGKGDAVLIVASDLEEEVPVWRLRVKQAHDRGALLVVMNGRPTRMDDFANVVIHYDYSKAAGAFDLLQKQHKDVAKQLQDAANLVVIAGAEGVDLAGSRALMQDAANFLMKSGHVGKPNNGLLATLPGANGMGQYYLGFTPEATQDIIANPPKALIVAQADLLFDDPAAVSWLKQVETIIQLTLFAEEPVPGVMAALPIQSFAERDGSFVNGERRVQRFYTAQGPLGQALPAWQVLGRLNEQLGAGRAKLSASLVMNDIAKNVPAFAGMSYKALAHVEPQFPEVGGDNVYYGGTAYRNKGGLGVQIPAAADNGGAVEAGKADAPKALKVSGGQLLVVPAARLYNRERVFRSSELVHPRVPDAYVEINAADAQKLGIENGDMVNVNADGTALKVRAHVNGAAPQGAVILPRHLSNTPVPLAITVGEISKA